MSQSPRITETRALRWIATSAVALLAATSLRAEAELDDDAMSTFEDGTPIFAEDINNQFNALFDAVNELEERTPVLCGATVAVSPGDLGGYTGATATCRNPALVEECGMRAHMCTAHEIVLLASEGETIPGGWFSTGTAVSNGDALVSDCAGWTDSTGTLRGTYWAEGANRPDTATCNFEARILCCE